MEELEIVEPKLEGEESEAPSEEKPTEETTEEKTKETEKPAEENSDKPEESPVKKLSDKDYDSSTEKELLGLIGSGIQALKRKKLPFPKGKGKGAPEDKEEMSIKESMLELLSKVYEILTEEEPEPEPEEKPAKEMAKEFMSAISEKDKKISQLSEKLSEASKKLETLDKPKPKAVEKLSDSPSGRKHIFTKDGGVYSED